MVAPFIAWVRTDKYHSVTKPTYAQAKVALADLLENYYPIKSWGITNANGEHVLLGGSKP